MVTRRPPSPRPRPRGRPQSFFRTPARAAHDLSWVLSQELVLRVARFVGGRDVEVVHLVRNASNAVDDVLQGVTRNGYASPVFPYALLLNALTRHYAKSGTREADWSPHDHPGAKALATLRRLGGVA